MIIYRDVGVYILATLSTVIFASMGSISWISSVILLGLYVLLVTVVLIEMAFKGNKDSNMDPARLSVVSDGNRDSLISELDEPIKRDSSAGLGLILGLNKKKMMGAQLRNSGGISSIFEASNQMRIEAFIKAKIALIRKKRKTTVS